MNKHVHNDQSGYKEVLELVEHPRQRDSVRYIQDDSDYPVDPLDLPDYAPAPGKAATEERQGVEG